MDKSMENDNNKNAKDPSLDHLDMQTAGAASSTDCTGLIPANPREDDIEEYKDILNYGSGEAEG